MPKTTFIRKPSTLENVLEETSRRAGSPRDSYYVAKEIQLEENSFFELCDNLLADRAWVEEFSNQAHPMHGNAVAAIRVTCAHSLKGLIIDPQGFSYPRYVGLSETSE